ncbi:MAG TPA: methyltransferase domain-containing protein [Pyrinomonadaceae bacterium]|nr:methyltransferase domain-containing protein [Pyrinomonadaceae bacterium]
MKGTTNLDTSYDRLSPYFRSYSETRAAYLSAVDRIILQRISPQANSLLDVGSGDGLRAARLAAALSLPRLVLSDPSEKMADRCRLQPAASVWPVAAEDLPDAGERFDVITCLWNVLGLVANSAQRVAALRKMGALLSAQGQLFLDVNNRYNARAYGWLPAFGRAIYDLLRPSELNGDVSFSWQIGETLIHSSGHVFRPAEMSGLIESAGLKVRRRSVVDYQTGERRRFVFEGQLFYELAKK